MGSALSETSASGLSENLRAAGCMVACMAGFATNDACMKSLAGGLPISRILAGSGIVVATGIFTIHRERRARAGRGGRT